MIELSTKLFTVDKAQKMFIAEHSDLPPRRGQLYGFALISQNTGKTSDWAFKHEEFSNDEDDELLCTIYVPTVKTLMEQPQLKGWTVHILND